MIQTHDIEQLIQRGHRALLAERKQSETIERERAQIRLDRWHKACDGAARGLPMLADGIARKSMPKDFTESTVNTWVLIEFTWDNSLFAIEANVVCYPNGWFLNMEFPPLRDAYTGQTYSLENLHILLATVAESNSQATVDIEDPRR
jgi:hypothetical protein